MQEIQLQASSWVVALAPFTPYIVEFIKDARFTDRWVKPEQKNRVFAVSALIAAACAFVGAFLDQRLDEGVFNALVATTENFVVAFGLQELAYRHIWKRLQVKSDEK